MLDPCPLCPAVPVPATPPACLLHPLPSSCLTHPACACACAYLPPSGLPWLQVALQPLQRGASLFPAAAIRADPGLLLTALRFLSPGLAVTGMYASQLTVLH